MFFFEFGGCTKLCFKLRLFKLFPREPNAKNQPTLTAFWHILTAKNWVPVVLLPLFFVLKTAKYSFFFSKRQSLRMRRLESAKALFTIVVPPCWGADVLRYIFASHISANPRTNPRLYRSFHTINVWVAFFSHVGVVGFKNHEPNSQQNKRSNLNPSLSLFFAHLWVPKARSWRMCHRVMGWFPSHAFGAGSQRQSS